MTTHYASTYFYQNDQEFQVDWDLTATKDDPTEEETISHLAAILEENWEETWGLEDADDDDEDDSLPSTLNLFGLTATRFARELVLNPEEAEKRFGVTWTISTRWEEVDSDNWEHPCNL